ncbi:hypothetical protein [Acetonema longum]|uniref:Uncharacterized protein n=1 Tax=Acetonema longum DSM 6540 TaxID=1009370 RepID=F7NLD4_9FIRM|nr:hypothetical protein [Acetonema longum]EGO63239.1 hypothetical protein ALO_14532 [Acetonema longum DSM 6540]
MRQFFVSLLILCLLTNTAAALAPMNGAAIREAHQYGKQHNRTVLSDFLIPWISYEEKVTAINDAADRAYLYTPFLLLALDAREKTLQGKAPGSWAAEKVLTEYTGFVVISVILYGDSPDFVKGTEAALTQDGRIFRLYHATFPGKTVRTAWTKPRPLYSAQCYFYFYDQGLDNKKTLLLNLTNKGQQRKFYFDLEKIK